MLDGVSAAARKALIARSSERRFASGEMLWAAGDEPKWLALVLEGRVRVLRAAGGRQTVIHSGEEGDTLGEIPFFTRAAYPATAMAAEPTRCLLLTYEAMEHAMTIDSSLALYFLKRLSLRVEALVQRVAGLSGQSVDARLARFIMSRTATGGRDAAAPFSLGMTQAELAEELGTVREVLVRSLRSLVDAGAIERAGGGRYRVVNVQALRSLVGSVL